MFKKIMMISSLAVMLTFAVHGQKRGVPVTQDDFETEMTFAEKWIPKGAGIKPEKGRVLMSAGVLRTRDATPSAFYAEAELALQPSPASASTGFKIAGLRFAIRPDGEAGLIKNGALENPLRIEGFALGKAVKLTLIREVDGDKAKYIFRVNGKEAATATENSALAKTLEIFSDKAKLELDNFALFTLKNANESNNVIINSGFEYEQDGFPPYICRSESFDYGKYQSVPYEKYLATCSLDTKEKHSGKQSLKLVNTDFTSGQWLRMHSAATMKDVPGVFSVWMKADQEDFPVTIAYGKAKEVMVDKEWKRYEVVNEKLPKPGIYSPVVLGFKKKKGTLWVDDMQAEILDSLDPTDLKTGKTFATPFRPSALDKERLGKQEAPERAPEITVPKLPAGLVPNGDLDTWKDKAVKRDNFHAWTKPPQNKTEAFFACDDKNFYVGVRAYQKDLSELNTKVVKHDTMAIGSRDAIELLIDPLATGASFQYYQFLALLGSSRADRGMGMDASWDGDWKTIVKVDESNSCLDYEITIPFASLASPEMKSRWLMNVHRYDMSTKEALTLINSQTPSFRSLERWPYVQFPADVTTRFKVGATAGGYTDSPGGSTVSFDMMNNTGNSLVVKAELIDAQNNTGLFGAQDVTLKKGASSLAFVSKVKTNKVRLKLTKDGAPLADQTIFLEKREPVSMLGRLNYYMKESEAPFRVKTSVANPKKLVAVLSCGGVSVKRKAAAKFQIALPLKDIPDGTHDVKLALMDGDKTMAETTRVLVKRPYKKGATQINHFARCVMHEGKPVLMSAPFLADIHFFRKNRVQILSDLLAFFKKSGFRHSVMMTKYINEKNSTKEECIRLLDEANKNDIKVVLMTKYDSTTDGKVDEVIRQLDFPNIIGQIVSEEAELSVPSDVTRDFLRKMRPKFPYQPTIMNNTVLGISARYANLETDVLMVDDYITNSKRTVASVVEQTDGMWKAGAAEGKPCWYFVVGGNFPLHYREPTYGEQMTQCYGNIAAGCTGICYFYGNFQTPGNWKAVLQFNQEILPLTDALCSEEETTDAVSSGDPKYLRVRTKKHDGHLYLITCNIDENPAGKVTFTLPAEFQYNDQAEVLYENRKIQVKDGKFSDDFSGHSRHVYKIKIK